MDNTENPAEHSLSGDYTSSSDMSPLEKFRTDPVFKSLKTFLMQNPHKLCTAIQRLGDLDEQVMHDINDNHQEFLAMLTEDCV